MYPYLGAWEGQEQHHLYRHLLQQKASMYHTEQSAVHLNFLISYIIQQYLLLSYTNSTKSQLDLLVDKPS